MQPWRTALQTILESAARPVEKLGHQPRLYALTRLIGTSLEYDDDTVYAAAYLHDLGVFLGHRPEDAKSLSSWDHVAYAIGETPRILDEIGFPVEKVAAVLEAIQNHQPKDVPQSLESTILRDADILEQLGAIGILRTVSKIGRDTRFHTFTDAVQALTRALETLPSRIALQSTRELARERIWIHTEWLQAVKAEAASLLL